MKQRQVIAGIGHALQRLDELSNAGLGVDVIAQPGDFMCDAVQFESGVNFGSQYFGNSGGAAGGVSVSELENLRTTLPCWS